MYYVWCRFAVKTKSLIASWWSVSILYLIKITKNNICTSNSICCDGLSKCLWAICSKLFNRIGRNHDIHAIWMFCWLKQIIKVAHLHDISCESLAWHLINIFFMNFNAEGQKGSYCTLVRTTKMLIPDSICKYFMGNTLSNTLY